jgi:fructose-1,6-bisphosphatase/inositol monophosphatase family enzyme
MSTSNPDFYSEQDRPALQRMRKATRWRVYGGSCTAYARVASGRVDVGFDVDFDIHDYLALVPVVNGAGGQITDWNGRDLTLNSADRFVAAGDRRVHRQALELLQAE